ncbi:hypothetical protein [Paracoccus mutanolyticus]|uniref:hypothetical protein n=1 Tax=Paracoccus mutanolyticus TaxID=1499308 RepID=UPI001678656D|nr:hypothetical protein [Paracoccus mutanolyticus]
MLLDEGFDRPRHAAVLPIRRYSQETWPGMLDALDSSLDLSPIATIELYHRALGMFTDLKSSGEGGDDVCPLSRPAARRDLSCAARRSRNRLSAAA